MAKRPFSIVWSKDGTPHNLGAEAEANFDFDGIHEYVGVDEDVSNEAVEAALQEMWRWEFYELLQDGLATGQWTQRARDMLADAHFNAIDFCADGQGVSVVYSACYVQLESAF